ncbi:hypothetical protein [Gemmatimonas sp.]
MNTATFEHVNAAGAIWRADRVDSTTVTFLEHGGRARRHTHACLERPQDEPEDRVRRALDAIPDRA